jgi:hypothetical protein
MQVSNIEITVSNEIALEVLVGQVEETTSTLRFTELQFVGGGNGAAVLW